MSFFSNEKDKHIEDSFEKAICKYNVIDDKNKYAEGILYFMGEQFKFISGKYGDGYAPKGPYKAYADQLKHRDEDSYSQFGFGWCLPLGPQFETTRTQLMAHPDGGVVGTKGCIGFTFATLDENVTCYNLFRDFFEKSNILNVEIV